MMTDYEKLKSIIDEIDVLIEKGVRSSDSEFEAWQTKAERFLTKRYGEKSLEYKKFTETHFTLMVYAVGTPHSDFVKKCRDGLKTTKTIFLTYVRRNGRRKRPVSISKYSTR